MPMACLIPIHNNMMALNDIHAVNVSLYNGMPNLTLALTQDTSITRLEAISICGCTYRLAIGRCQNRDWQRS